MPVKGKKAKTFSNPSEAPANAQKEALPTTTPNWPAFRPLVPELDLTFDDICPDQIVTIQNFWTATLCKNYVSFLSTLPLTTTPGTPKKGEAVRVNDRFQVTDAFFAERLWSETALKNLVLGSNKNNGLVKSSEDAIRIWGGEVVSR